MRIVLIGGHLSPLLAVIDALPKDAAVLVVGRKKALEGDSSFSLEYQSLREKKISFKPIITGRWQRRFTRYTLFSFLKIPIGFIQSIFILKRFKPEVVLSFGSYVSAPVTFAAFLLQIPVVLHEQTLGAGLANRLVSFFAKKVCISWESSMKFFPKSKTVLTGNPIREFKIQNSTPIRSGSKFKISKIKELPLIYITGGSLGSHAINVLVEGCLEKLLNISQVMHQTGDAQEFMDFQRLEKIKKTLPLELQNRYKLTKFVDPQTIGSIMASSQLVVSRAGINTVTEIIYFKKPCILIPLPFSQNNEQLKNALFLKDFGFAEIIDQEKITSLDFYKQIALMIENLDKYKKAEESSKKINVEDSAKNIVEVLKLGSIR